MLVVASYRYGVASYRYGKDVCAEVSLRRYGCEPTAIGGQLCVHMGLFGAKRKGDGMMGRSLNKKVGVMA